MKIWLYSQLQAGNYPHMSASEKDQNPAELQPEILQQAQACTLIQPVTSTRPPQSSSHPGFLGDFHCHKNSPPSLIR